MTTTFVQTFEGLTNDALTQAGGKGANLARMHKAGFPVPDGFVILPGAFEDADLKQAAWEQVKTALQALRAGAHEATFAVRSSALSEDSAQASFAGEFESVLNVHTDDEIRQAIRTVFASRHNERVQAYSQTRGMNGEHQIAVVVQELVAAESSGVLFTANPVTGQRDQVMISAAWGLGEAIVQGVVTPDTLIVDKSTGKVIRRDTADKQMMTVRRKGGTAEHSVPQEKRHEPVLSDRQAASLTALGTRIEAFYGMPMDIEWVLVDDVFTIVQARPITALPASEPPPLDEWKLPEGKYSAMRNNIVELMADPLTPLFRTLGIDAINASMNRTLAAFMGKPGLMPEDLIITVNQYAYYNGSLAPGQILRILLNGPGIGRRMFTGAVERWTEQGRPRYVTIVESWKGRTWHDMPTPELLAAARELTEAAVDAYMALVSGVIPAAWITEGIFTTVYKVLVKRKDGPGAPTFLIGFDSLPIRAEKNLYDIALWVQSQPSLAGYLLDTPTQVLAAQPGDSPTPAGIDASIWRAWRDRFQSHLNSYGHTIYNLDFANPVPADDPAPLLETLKLFVSGQGTNPYERQQQTAKKRADAVHTVEDRLGGLRRKVFHKVLAPAQRYAPLREDGLADVGLSYPLVRQMLSEVGQRFVDGGLLEKVDDIYWLTGDEVQQAATRLDAGEPLVDRSSAIPDRKAEWRAARRVSPPRMLPQIKLFGVDLMELKSGRAGSDGDTIKGVAASPGTVTARACVVHGPEDFERMQTGDVLVAPMTTPAWTPLFARAAAVVTDVGGPLSHGSIVAREYGIPAVLGTGIATTRIHTGQMLTVDGTKGTILRIAKE